MTDVVEPSVCLQAITGFLNLVTPFAESQRCQHYLIGLRENPLYASALFAILSVEQDDGIRVFCLTALQEWTKRWWKEMPPPQQLELRNNISTIVSTIPEEASVGYCSKCASIVVEIAERQFPELWPTFVDDLLTLWVTGSFAKQQTTLKTLHDLYTDCTDPDFTAQLSTTRRQEIIAALQPHHQRIIGLVEEFLCNHLQEYATHQHNPQYPALALHTRSIVLALELMEEMAALVPIEEWLTHAPRSRFVDVFGFLLRAADFQLLVVGLLQKLVRHEIPTERELVLRALVAFLATGDEANGGDVLTPRGDDDDERIRFVSGWATVLSGVLQANWTQLHALLSNSQRNATAEGRALTATVQTLFGHLVTLVRQPLSVKAAGDSVLDVQRIFHAGRIDAVPFLVEGCGAILEAYFDRAQKALFVDYPTLAAEEAWFEVEFEGDRDEYNEFFGTFLSKCQLLLVDVAREAPLPLVRFVQEQLQATTQLAQRAFDAHCAAPATAAALRLRRQFEKRTQVLCRALAVSCEQLVAQHVALHAALDATDGDAAAAASAAAAAAAKATKKKVKRPPTADETAASTAQRRRLDAVQAALQALLPLVSALLTWALPTATPPQDATVEALATVQREQLRLLDGCVAVFTLPALTRALLPPLLTQLFAYVTLPTTTATAAPATTMPALLSVSDAAATTLATLLHRAARHVDDPSLFDALLETTSTILAAPTYVAGGDGAGGGAAGYSDATQMAMRETLVVLANFLPPRSPLQASLVALATTQIVDRIAATADATLRDVDTFAACVARLRSACAAGDDASLVRLVAEALTPLRDGLVAFVQVTRKADTARVDDDAFGGLFDVYATAAALHRAATDDAAAAATAAGGAAASSSATGGAAAVAQGAQQAAFVRVLQHGYAAALAPRLAATPSWAAQGGAAAVAAEFPLAAAWWRVLDALRGAVPVMLQLTLATTPHPAAAQVAAVATLPPAVAHALHDTALSDLCRLLQRRYTAEDTAAGGWALHELWRSLWINVAKALDAACRQRVFFAWPAAAPFVRDEVVARYLPALSPLHLGRWLRYFCSAYVLNAPPRHVLGAGDGDGDAAAAVYAPCVAALWRTFDARLQQFWLAAGAGGSGVAALAPEDDDGLAALRGRVDFLSDDAVAIARDYRARELCAQYVDLLVEVVGLKGPLCADSSGASRSGGVGGGGEAAPAASTGGSGGATAATLSLEERKTSRRELLRHVVFARPLPTSGPSATGVATLGEQLCVAVSWLLQVPDVHVFKAALGIAQYLLEEVVRSYGDAASYAAVWARYEAFVQRDVVRHVLRVLLQQEAWAVGLGWDLVDYLLLVLRMYVLLLPLDVPTTPAALAQGHAGVAALPPCVAVPRQRCDAAIEEFVATALVTPAEVERLLGELSRGTAKKRQRALLKDFVSLVMIAKIHDASQLQLRGSELVATGPKVDTAGADETAKKKKAAKKAKQLSASVFAALAERDQHDDLTAGLFDDI